MDDYKLLGHDDDAFTIQHPDGSSFRVAKSKLDEAMIKKISSMKSVQKMASGGIVGDFGPGMTMASNEPSDSDVVSDVMAQTPVSETADRPNDVQNKIDERTQFYIQNQPGIYKNDPQSAQRKAQEDILQSEQTRANSESARANSDKAEAAKRMSEDIAYNAQAQKLGLPLRPIDTSGADQIISQQAVPQASQPNVSSGIEQSATHPQANPPGLLQGSPMDQLKQNLGQQIQGVQGIADAKSQESKETANAYQQNLKQQQALTEQYNTQRAQIETQNADLFKQVNEGKIDPHRLWNNASTGNKIMAGIGLLLGGIGSGLNGQPNMAMQVMQKSIDQDIEAQKDNLNKKAGLLSQNMQKYRDLGTAEAATRVQMNTMLQAQIAKSAAQSGNKQAQANAQMMIAQLKQQQMPMVQQLAMAGLQAQSLGASSGQGGLPVGQEPVGMLADPKYQEKRIVVGGRAYQAPSHEDAKALRDLQSEYEPVRSMVNQLDALGPEATVPGSEANLKAQALRASLVPRINKMHGLNRLSEEDIHIMADQLKDPTKFGQLMNGGIKTSQFLKNLGEDLDANYKTRLLGYKGPSQYKTFKPAE